MRRLSFLFTGIAAAPIAVMLAVACGSSSKQAPTCNEDPWQCGGGATCWPQGCNCPSGWQFACLTSDKNAVVGQGCSLQIGQTTCGDLQTCVALEDAGGGACRSYCDPANPAHGCLSGQFCAQLTVGSATPAPTEHVCLPLPTDQDAQLSVDAPGGGYDDVIIVIPDASGDVPPKQQ